VAEEQSGFLSRWARRKTDVLQGKPVPESVAVAKPVLPEPVQTQVEPAQAQGGPKPPELSLGDVKLLSKDSDFKPFMAQDVSVDVRNAAMKKLFADPHFNVMDGLDIYIDDYSKSDPIPEAMLRAMTGSKLLKLFDDEDELDKEDNRDTSNGPDPQGVESPRENLAQSQADSDGAEAPAAPQINQSQAGLLSNPVASQPDHDDPHLRLQSDHAAPEPEARRRTK
jgi:hypothetical protein